MSIHWPKAITGAGVIGIVATAAPFFPQYAGYIAAAGALVNLFVNPAKNDKPRPGF